MAKLQTQAIDYDTLQKMYDAKYIKQLGNKIIVVIHAYGLVYGYDIQSYDGYVPKILSNKVYTDINNINHYGRDMFDAVYDYFYGNPIYNV